MKKEGKKLKWDDSDLEYLKENYGRMALDDIGMHLKVSHTAVRLKAMELGLSNIKYRSRCEWTDEQIDYLKSHYHKETISDLSWHIGFSSGTIVRKANALGLKKNEDYSKVSFYRRYVKDYKHSSK